MSRVPRGPITLVVLTEDAAVAARPTLRALVHRMARLVDRACETQRIDFEPTTGAESAAMHANRWKSRAPADHGAVVGLRRAIATHLARGHIVLFHFDADRPWRERDRSENRRRFELSIVAAVRQAVAAKPVLAPRVDTILAGLEAIAPCYSIEAWLYQNTPEAVRLCREEHGGRDVARFEEWAADRTLLDDVSQPKEQVCLRSRHNAELASRAYPAEVVYAVGRSFAATVDALKACAPLCAGLARTHFAAE